MTGPGRRKQTLHDALPGASLRKLSIFAIDTSQTYHAGAAGLLGGRAGTGTDPGRRVQPFRHAFDGEGDHDG